MKPVDLIQEYEKQQTWRNWERYLQFIPISQDDSVVDLGCSVGGMSRLFSSRVKRVLGLDINQELIDFCESKKRSNETFICADFQNIKEVVDEPFNGVWSSYSLSYFRYPLDVLVSIYSLMKQGGWIALLDVSCFISGNLARNSKYYERVKRFELESCNSGIYDFNFGAKMESLLQSVGFEIEHVDNDVADPELNFDGAAPKEIVEGWASRLGRMQKLKEELGVEYNEFCKELLSGLCSDYHEKQENVKFVVARKF